MPKIDNVPTGSDAAATAARLKALRIAFGLSGKYVAEQCGVSASQYSRYEAGLLNITVSSSIGIADLYGVDLDFVIRGEVNQVPLSVAERLNGLKE